MAVFRVERNRGYTVMSNHHLRNRDLTLKAKGLLSQMLSLPDNWDYTVIFSQPLKRPLPSPSALRKSRAAHTAIITWRTSASRLTRV